MSGMSLVIEPRHRAGSGEPLVLLHGFTGTWRVWLPVIPRLAERFDVIVPTLGVIGSIASLGLLIDRVSRNNT